MISVVNLMSALSFIIKSGENKYEPSVGLCVFLLKEGP